MSIQPVVFCCSCIKTLSAVEANPARSNQHEFNGVTQLKSIFGEARLELQALFSLRGDSQVFQSAITWYDAREAHATRSEYRLYFQGNPVMKMAAEGDNIVIGYDRDGNVHCELIPSTNPDYNGRISEWRFQ